EEDDPGDEDALAAEEVSERAGIQHHACEHERVGVHDPLQVGEGGVELLPDRRQGDVDDGDVQEEHENGDTDDDECAPFPVHERESYPERAILQDSATLLRKVSGYGAHAVASAPERSGAGG